MWALVGDVPWFGERAHSNDYDRRAGSVASANPVSEQLRSEKFLDQAIRASHIRADFTRRLGAYGTQRPSLALARSQFSEATRRERIGLGREGVAPPRW